MDYFSVRPERLKELVNSLGEPHDESSSSRQLVRVWIESDNIVGPLPAPPASINCPHCGKTIRRQIDAAKSEVELPRFHGRTSIGD